METSKTAPMPTIRRLPAYLRLLIEYNRAGLEWISTTAIAAELDLKPIQVRKDMSFTGIIGKPRKGFEVKESISAIESFLGWQRESKAVLAGCGALGSALLGYRGFTHQGLKIQAAFDQSREVIGKTIHGIPVLDIADLKKYVIENIVTVGIITVPEQFGQQVADIMVDSGITGLWNFSPVKLKVPSNITVQNEDLSSGLAVLSVRLGENQNNEL